MRATGWIRNENEGVLHDRQGDSVPALGTGPDRRADARKKGDGDHTDGTRESRGAGTRRLVSQVPGRGEAQGEMARTGSRLDPRRGEETVQRSEMISPVRSCRSLLVR
jgi:hypothetical protein